VKGVISVGTPADYPSDAWGSRDNAALDERIRNEGRSADVVSASVPGELGCSIFPEATGDRARSAGVDRLLEQHGVGRRGPRRPR
jgi:hypothetical protein